MTRSAAAAIAFLAVAACAQPQPAEEHAANSQASATPPGQLAPTPVDPKPYKVEQDNDLLEFSYAYPAEAAAIPAIVTKLSAEEKRGKTDALQMASEDKKERGKSDFPFNPHSLETSWSVHGDSPRFLSLLSETYVFTGGAHGMTAYGALLWDREANREATFQTVLTSPTAFDKAVRDRFCDALDKARAEKRGEPVTRSDEMFDDCIDPMKQTLVLEGEKGKPIDRILVVIGPYEAGPYAEGSYEIPLKVDAAMLKAIKPEYQAAFTAAR
jgi:hypothetical protein